ncbi:MAG: helix-turn-helix domain-containing protein [Proteobacteria bacterium]|nr:helix-turn-helix domain-containing protein [Pseudomonadota bacterium]MBU1739899.1 helix-turn-helix domain-containing protein [Pseudomonadota bacterium]
MARDLFISEAAEQAGVHPNTLKRYEERGLVHARRDFRGWRRFPPAEVTRLRDLLDRRTEPQVEGAR